MKNWTRFSGFSDDVEACPLCRNYYFAPDLDDVARERHAPQHSVEEWQRVIDNERDMAAHALEQAGVVAAERERDAVRLEQWRDAAS